MPSANSHHSPGLTLSDLVEVALCRRVTHLSSSGATDRNLGHIAQPGSGSSALGAYTSPGSAACQSLTCDGRGHDWGFPPTCGHQFLCGGSQRSRPLLVLNRADLTESGMPPSGVVTSDPTEHRSTRLTRTVPALSALQCLPFQRRVERLRSSVVRARSDRTPRPGDTQLTAHVGELRRGVLSPVIGVKDGTVETGGTAQTRQPAARR